MCIRDSHEGSAWNYTFFVPHDVEGLAKLMGGRRKFVDKLQMVFDEGLYDPANEPDIAYAYLFSRFPGEEWRTQREVRRLLAKYFTLSLIHIYTTTDRDGKRTYRSTPEQCRS